MTYDKCKIFTTIIAGMKFKNRVMSWKYENSRKIKREKQENVEQSRFQANKSVKVVFDLHENWIFVTENDNCCKNNAIEDKIIII